MIRVELEPTVEVEMTGRELGLCWQRMLRYHSTRYRQFRTLVAKAFPTQVQSMADFCTSHEDEVFVMSLTAKHISNFTYALKKHVPEEGALIKKLKKASKEIVVTPAAVPATPGASSATEALLED